jgi:hypothetical protein
VVERLVGDSTQDAGGAASLFDSDGRFSKWLKMRQGSVPVVGVDDEPGDDRVRQRGDEEGPVRVEGVRQHHHGEAEQEQDHDRSESAAFGHALILEGRRSFAPCGPRSDRDRIRACSDQAVAAAA